MIYDKLIKKIILVLIFSLISCIIFTSTTYAGSIDDMISSADDFLKTGQDDVISLEALRDTSNYIYNTLLIIAVAIAVIVGTYLGIKFMLESAEDKAKIKEAMIPFIVGCFIIFGAFGIWKIVVNVGDSISGDTKYEVPGFATTECSVCGKKVHTSDEVHERKCKECKNAGK